MIRGDTGVRDINVIGYKCIDVLLQVQSYEGLSVKANLGRGICVSRRETWVSRAGDTHFTTGNAESFMSISNHQ